MADYLPPAPSVAPALQRALWVGAAQVLIAGLLCSMILDGGRLLACCLISTLGLLAGAAAVAGRRGRRPTRGDLIFVGAGFFALWAWSMAIAATLGR